MYVGCWEDKNVNTMFNKDDDNSRDFEIYIAVSSQPWYGMTLNRCVPACVTLGYRYAALQVSIYDCFFSSCGSYTLHGAGAGTLTGTGAEMDTIETNGSLSLSLCSVYST